MALLDTRRFDRLSDEEVLDLIDALLAVAVGRFEEQRRLNALAGAGGTAAHDFQEGALLDLTQLVTDPLEARIITHLRAAARTPARWRRRSE